MSAGPELRALTSARGIAAWLVVLFHLRGALAGLPPALAPVLAHGYLAVDFFFLLSGFVLALRHGARLRAGGWAAVPVFLQRRIARIWPLHAVMLAFALLLTVVLRATGRATPAFPLAELPAHLLLLQSWGLADPLRWNDPAWSISCEMAAYLLFALAMAARGRGTPPNGNGVSRRSVLLVLATLGLLHALYAAHGATNLGQDIPRLGVLRCLLEFTAGTGLHALWDRWRARGTPAALRCFLAAALLAGAGTMLPETLVAPPALAALLLALALTAGRRGHPLEGRMLHRLGEISYATYLSHYLLWFTFKLAFVRGATIGWPLAALYLALVLAASVALHRLVERPAQRWINRLALRPWRKPLATR